MPFASICSILKIAFSPLVGIEGIVPVRTILSEMVFCEGFRPTFDGWELIESGYRVYIDNFVPQGDILAPGVSDCDRDIREGDEVLVVGENALATGKAMMGADEMLSSRRGVAVRVRKVKKL